MEHRIFRITILLLVLFFTVYFGFQLAQIFYHPEFTKIATAYPYDQKIPLDGIVVKQEKVLDETYFGTVEYNVKNAKKVVAKTDLATVYKSEEAFLRHRKANSLQQKIDLLERVQAQISSDGLQKNTTTQMEQIKLAVLYDMESEVFDHVSDQSMDYLFQLLQYEKTLNPAIDYSAQIARLDSEIKTLQIEETIGIESPSEGYFTSVIDGYETVFDERVLENLSTDAIRGLIEQQGVRKSSTEQNIGKLILDTEWKYVALVPSDMLEHLAEGQKVNVLLADGSVGTVKMTVQQIVPVHEEKWSSIVLMSRELNDQTINLRKAQAEILLESGSGIRVSRSAVRMKDTQMGVYVRKAKTPVFKKIDVIDSGEDFFISRLHEGDRDFLQLYDEVFVNFDEDFLETSSVPSASPATERE